LPIALALLVLATFVPATQPRPLHFGDALPFEHTPQVEAPLPHTLLGRPELVERREEFARHYGMGDGRFVAFVSPTPLNYRDRRGNWQPIDARFSPADGGFEMRHNSLQSFLGSHSTVLHLEHAGISVAWRPIALEASYAETSPEQLATPLPPDETGAPELIEGGRVLRYDRAWSVTQVAEQFQSLPGGVKQELLIGAPPQAPAGAEWLELRAALSFPLATAVFAEGQQQTGDFVTAGPIELRGADGALLLMLDPPLAYERDNPREAVAGRYAVSRTPGGLELRVQTPWAWWRASGRQYPAVLDPTIHVVRATEQATFTHRRTFEDGGGGEPVSGVTRSVKGGICIGHFDVDDGDFDVRGYERGYLRFSLPTLPFGAIAQSAQVVLAAGQGGGDSTLAKYGDRTARLPVYLLTNLADWRDELLSDPPNTSGFPAPDPAKVGARLKQVKKPDPGLPKGGLPLPATIWDVTSDVQGWYADPASNFGFTLRTFSEDQDFNDDNDGSGPTPGFHDFGDAYVNPLPSAGEPITLYPTFTCLPSSPQWSLDQVVQNLATPQNATTDAAGIGMLISYAAPQLPLEDLLDTAQVPSALPTNTFLYQYHEYALPGAQSGVSWQLVAAAGRTPLVDGISPYTPLSLVTPSGELKTNSDAGKASALNADFEHQPNLIAVNAGQGSLNLRVEVDNQPTAAHAEKLYSIQTADVVPAPTLAPTTDTNKLQATVPISIFRELARGRELIFNAPGGAGGGGAVEIKVPYADISEVGTTVTKDNAGLFELLLFAPGLPFGSRSDGAAARLIPGPDAYEIEFPVPAGASGPYLLVLQGNRGRSSATMPALVTLCKNSTNVVRYPVDGQCVELRRPPASVTDNTPGNEPAGEYREVGSGATRVRVYSPAGFTGDCAVNCTSNPTLAGVPVMPIIGYGDDGLKWVALKSGQVVIGGGSVGTSSDARLLLVDFSDADTIASLPVLRGQFQANGASGKLLTTSLADDTYLLVNSPLHVLDDNGGLGNKNGWGYEIDFGTDRLVANGPLARQLQPSVGGGLTNLSFTARWNVDVGGGPSLQGQITDFVSIGPSATFEVGSLFVTAPGDGNYGFERGPSVNGALPSAMPPFRHVRMTGATLSQGDAVGGAKLPVQAVILQPGVQVVDDEGLNRPVQCGAACFDLRGPTDALSAVGQVIDRQYDMPDLIVQENAGTVMIQDAGGLSVLSTDHPHAREAATQANSTSFSYEAFEAEVKTFKGICPRPRDPLTGQPVGPEGAVTTVVIGEATMSMPNVSSESAGNGGGAQIGVNFTLCGGALRDMGFFFDTGEQTGIPIGSSGLFLHYIGGQISIQPEAPGSPVIISIDVKLRGMSASADSATIFVAGRVTIDTRGLFDLQIHAGIAVSGVGVGVDGHFWVAWAPLDIGFEVQACVPKSIPDVLSTNVDICDESELLFGSLKLHLWQGQGWQNQYHWLPDDDSLHFTASFEARILISAGMIVDSGLLVLPPGDLELLGIKLAFGEFCVNASCTQFEWGILAVFTILGWDVGGYYGFDTGLSFFTGSGDDYVLIDEFGGQAAREGALAAQATQQTINVTPGTPSAMFALAWSNGQPAPTFSVKEPGVGGRTLTSASVFADVIVTTTPTGKSQQTLISVLAPKAGDWIVTVTPQSTATEYQFFYGGGKAGPKVTINPLPGVLFTSANPSMPISWTVSNAPATGAFISLYYSRTLTRQVSGTLVSQPIVGPIVEHRPLQPADSYTWDLSGLSEGVYQVYARIETNVAQVLEDCGNQPYNADLTQQGACDTLFNSAITVPPKDNLFFAPDSFSYRDFTPPAVPTGIKARNEGLSSLVVSWNPNSENDLSGYVATCTQGSLTRRARVVASASATSGLSETARVNGLNGGVAATCSVQAYDYSNNISDPSATAQATPSAAVPAPPAQVLQISVNPLFDVFNQKLKLSWAAVQGAQGYLIYYAPIFSPTNSLAAREPLTMQLGGLRLRTGSYQADEGRSPLNVGAATEAVLTGLAGNTTYQAQVRAYDAEGRLGPISQAFRFSTPPQPRELRLPLVAR
jgi:hypothetical protein